MRHTQLYFETKKPQFWVLDPSICLKKLSIGSRFKNLLSCVYCWSRLEKKAGWVVNNAIQRWPHEKASHLHNKYRAGSTGTGSGPRANCFQYVLKNYTLGRDLKKTIVLCLLEVTPEEKGRMGCKQGHPKKAA